MRDGLIIIMLLFANLAMLPYLYEHGTENEKRLVLYLHLFAALASVVDLVTRLF